MTEFEKKYLSDGPRDSEMHRPRTTHRCPKCGSEMMVNLRTGTYTVSSSEELKELIKKATERWTCTCGHEEKVEGER